MNDTRKSLATIVGFAVLAALVIPSFAPGAMAGPATPATTGAPQQWAFGGQRWANLSVSFYDGTFTSRAYYGEQVVITETNTSATTRQIEGVRTVGASYFAEYCQPNCTNPNASANLTLRAWQQLTAFVNLTTAATVYESSTGGSTVIGVAALGIDNASSSARGQLNESYSIMRGTHAGAHGSLGVTHRASMGVQFSPASGSSHGTHPRDRAGTRRARSRPRVGGTTATPTWTRCAASRRARRAARAVRSATQGTSRYGARTSGTSP